jgi:NAD(P)H-hydrate epimerase
MRLLLDADEMRRFDRATIDALGVSALALMETAGRAVAAHVHAAAPTGPILLLAGPGNNGGDALVAARQLDALGHETQTIVVDLGRPSAEQSAQRAIVERLGLRVDVAPPEALAPLVAGALAARPAAIVDGLFGTGLSRAIEGPLAAAIHAVGAARAPTFAIDVPSGIDATTGAILGAAIRATATIVLGAAKLGLLQHPARAHAGAVHVVDIGLPPRALASALAAPPRATWIEDADLSRAFPRRARDAHKGHFGHVGVIAGEPDRPGSALLATEAALVSGAGLVTLGSDDETIRRAAPALRERMGRSLGAPRIDPSRALELADQVDALALGPSLDGRGADRDAIRAIVERAPCPLVVDAGALDAFVDAPARLTARRGPAVLTPHPGEAARLARRAVPELQADRPAAARALAAEAGAVVVLKGASTTIAAPDGRLALVTRGNPGLATGGTGDVLAGVIAALLARGLDAFEATALGAQLHALAGDVAAARVGEAGLRARDLVAAIPRVARAIERGGLADLVASLGPGDAVASGPRLTPDAPWIVGVGA